MNKFTDILNYELFVSGNYKLTVFNIFILIFIFFFVKILLIVVRKLIKKRMQRKGILDEGRLYSFSQLIKYFAYTIALILSLESIGVNVSILIAGSAALLVGVGLGLQEVFKDLLSGLIILFEGNLKVGDIIELEDLIGKITEINLRTCEVETRDSVYIIVPNSKFVNDKIINWSHNLKKTRFKIKIGVAYGSDVKLVEQILIDCAKSHPDVILEEPPIVQFSDFGESSLDFFLIFWSDRIWQSETLKSEIRFIIADKFKQNGIQIPFPQLDLHVKSDATKK